MPKLTDKGQKVLGQLLKAEKDGSISSVDQEILGHLKQASGIYGDEGPTAGDYGKAALASVGETLSAPGRGLRGVGVGVQTGSMERAAEAVKPTYQAKPGEKIGAFTGQAVGEAASLAAGGALAKAPKAVGPLYRIGRGVVEGAALGGAEAAAQSGGDVKKTAKGAGVGAAGGAAGSSLAELAGLASRAIGKTLKSKSARGVGEAAMERIADNPEALRKAKGTPGSVRRSAKNLLSKAEQARSTAGQTVGDARKKLGLPDRLETAIDEFLNAPVEQADSLAKSVADRLKSPPPADPAAKLRYLDDLKYDLDKLVNWNQARSLSEGAAKVTPIDTTALKALREKVVDQLSGVPITGVNELQAANRNFATVSDAYETLFPKLKTEGTAEELLKALAASPKDATGKVSDVRKALKVLGITRTASSGQKQAAANLLKTADVGAGGPVQALVEALSPAGKANLFKGGSVIERLGNALPGAKPAVVVGKTLVDLLSGRRERRGEN